jgi:hypothetical protein
LLVLNADNEEYIEYFKQGENLLSMYTKDLPEDAMYIRDVEQNGPIASPNFDVHIDFNNPIIETITQAELDADPLKYSKISY